MMTSHTIAAAPARILRRDTVLARVGLSYSTVWRMYRAGRFPAPIRISPGAVGWLESEIDQWLAERIEAAGR